MLVSRLSPFSIRNSDFLICHALFLGTSCRSCSCSDELCPVFIRDGAFSIQSSMKFLNCHGLFIGTSCLVLVRTELCSVVIRNGAFFLFETPRDS